MSGHPSPTLFSILSPPPYPGYLAKVNRDFCYKPLDTPPSSAPPSGLTTPSARVLSSNATSYLGKSHKPATNTHRFRHLTDPGTEENRCESPIFITISASEETRRHSEEWDTRPCESSMHCLTPDYGLSPTSPYRTPDPERCMSPPRPGLGSGSRIRSARQYMMSRSVSVDTDTEILLRKPMTRNRTSEVNCYFLLIF